MATTKKTTSKKAPKRDVEKKALTKAEYDKFFSYIGKARVMANKLAKDANRRPDVRHAFNSIEKKLWNIGNDYFWGRLTDYK